MASPWNHSRFNTWPSHGGNWSWLWHLWRMHSCQPMIPRNWEIYPENMNSMECSWLKAENNTTASHLENLIITIGQGLCVVFCPNAPNHSNISGVEVQLSKAIGRRRIEAAKPAGDLRISTFPCAPIQRILRNMSSTMIRIFIRNYKIHHFSTFFRCPTHFTHFSPLISTAVFPKKSR